MLVRAGLDHVVQLTGFPRYSHAIDTVNWHIRFYQTKRSCSAVPILPDRECLYAHLNETYFHAGLDAIDYFEFGVFEGASLREWCRLNKNMGTRFWGFDSFEGLPEAWGPQFPTGSFHAGGRPPEIDDERVGFVTGLFQESLIPFLSTYQPTNRLLIHNDSDLYASTLYCLTAMDRLVPRGTLMMFDEFGAAVHEYKALTEYCIAFGRDYRIVAATPGFAQAAVEIL